MVQTKKREGKNRPRMQWWVVLAFMLAVGHTDVILKLGASPRVNPTVGVSKGTRS